MSNKSIIIDRKEINKALIDLIAVFNRYNQYHIKYYRDCCRLIEYDIKIEYIDNKYKVCYNDKLVFESADKNIVSAYIRSRI